MVMLRGRRRCRSLLLGMMRSMLVGILLCESGQ